MNKLTTDVAIIGGGLHGCSTALHLAKAGLKATVIEKGYVGCHASGNNAGGVRTLWRHEAEIPLALASLDLWHHIEELVDDRCGFQSYGQIFVAETESGIIKSQARLKRMHELGYTHERWIDPLELFERVPQIARHCLGGMIAEHDGSGSPYRTTHAFQRRAAAMGQTFVEGIRVLKVAREGESWRIETTAGHISARVVVNCAGAWGGQIAAQVGEPVPLLARASMMQVTLRFPRFLKPVIGCETRSLSFKQTAEGTLVIGGGRKGRLDLEAERTELDFCELGEAARSVLGLFPIMKGAIINRGWAGIEGRMPDGIPIIGPSLGAPNFFHQFGFTGHGFELGPIVGKIMADLITRGSCEFPIEPFSIGRFSDHSTTSAKTS